MNKKYIVKLTPDEREMLQQLIASGKASARKLTHARILLKADSTSSAGPNWSDQAISNALDISLSTIARVRQRFVEEGVSAALTSRRRSYRRSPILDGEAEAHLIAVACSEPPHGYGHWTLRLLADEMVEREYVESVSYETVRRTLKKTNLSRG
jgi:transposase